MLHTSPKRAKKALPPPFIYTGALLILSEDACPVIVASLCSNCSALLRAFRVSVGAGEFQSVMYYLIHVAGATRSNSTRRPPPHHPPYVSTARCSLPHRVRWITILCLVLDLGVNHLFVISIYLVTSSSGLSSALQRLLPFHNLSKFASQNSMIPYLAASYLLDYGVLGFVIALPSDVTSALDSPCVSSIHIHSNSMRAQIYLKLILNDAPITRRL